MKTAKSSFRLMVLALVLAALVLPACGKRRAKEEAPEGEAAAEAAEGDAIAAAEEEQKLQAQYDDVMYEKQITQARQHLKAGETQKALEAVEAALQHNPTSAEAMTLRAEVQRMLGARGGEVRTVIDDQHEAYRVKLDEQKVTVRRLLSEGETASAAQNWEAARRAYENATFIVTTSRLSPIGGDEELAALGEQAESGLRELERVQASERADVERRDTEQALVRVAEQEEKALLEARDRRARLLVAAIDSFNSEKFETAQHYAQQVLMEEPDNTVARDIVDHARNARHKFVNQSLLREQKRSFHNWQVDLERTKVPSSKILQWPAQSFWDQISRVRAVRAAGEATGRAVTPGEQGILNTLRTRQVDLAFDATAFPLVVNYLVAASGVNFVIDARAKEDLEAAEITLKATGLTVEDGLALIMMQASAEGQVVYEVVGNIVRFIKKEHQKRNLILRIHPVADLTLGLTDFIPPQITQVGVDEDSEVPLFGRRARTWSSTTRPRSRTACRGSWTTCAPSPAWSSRSSRAS
jgi:tetratricopeptide (TPR) repeat protein